MSTSSHTATPETLRASLDGYTFCGEDLRPAIAFCENLERERNAALAEIEAMRTEREEMRKALKTFWEALPERLRQEEENKAMREAIREAHEAFKVSLIRAYTAGYQHGHEATVEGGFIPVHHSDETEFHAENIHQMLCDGSLPESSALSKLQPFLP